MEILPNSVPTQYSVNSSEMQRLARANQPRNVTTERRDTVEIPIEDYKALTAIYSQLKNMEEMLTKMKTSLKESLKAREKEYEILKQEFEIIRKSTRKNFKLKKNNITHLSLGLKKKLFNN